MPAAHGPAFLVWLDLYWRRCEKVRSERVAKDRHFRSAQLCQRWLVVNTCSETVETLTWKRSFQGPQAGDSVQLAWQSAQQETACAISLMRLSHLIPPKSKYVCATCNLCLNFRSKPPYCGICRRRMKAKQERVEQTNLGRFVGMFVYDELEGGRVMIWPTK